VLEHRVPAGLISQPPDEDSRARTEKYQYQKDAAQGALLASSRRETICR